MIWEEPYDRSALEGNLSDFDQSVTLHKVDETRWERFWDRLVREHHYLGYENQFGGRVKYLATLGQKLVGAVSFCAGAYQLGPRDQFIGWDKTTRLKFLPHILNNNRFLILPWIRVRNLASNILAASLKLVREDWFKQYEVEPWLVETFVDRSLYEGTCYVASNWIHLGVTKGFGKIGRDFVYHGHEKDIYVYVLNRRFEKLFRPSVHRLPNEIEEILSVTTSLPIWHPNILEEIGVKYLTTEEFANLFASHLRPYFKYLCRKEHRTNMVAIITGLLSDLERKSLEPIALNYLKIGNVRNLAFFMTDSLFDNEAMLWEYQKEIGAFLFDPFGMFTCDGCDVAKKGKYSVGVARQYSGSLGKIDNCQAFVMLGFTGSKGYGLLDYELFMPEKWFEPDFKAQRERCKVPEDLKFKTKNQLILEMLHKAVASGNFAAKYVGVDCAFGRDHAFLDGLPEGLIYFASVPVDHHVFPGRPDMIVPEHVGRGRKPHAVPSFPSITVKDIVQDSLVPWEDVVLGIGAKGPIVTKDKLLKVVESRNGKPGKDVWLYARQMEDGSVKYALCNESMDASPMEVRTPALMRWSIEQCFHECKEYLGMDHYELRSWVGWRRHMLLVLIAHLFLNRLRLKFSVKKEDTVGPGPIPRRPVSLADYRKALIQHENSESIDHPDITLNLKAPWPVLTLGLLVKTIKPYLPFLGMAFEEANFQLKSMAASFKSRFLAIREKIMASE